jgi:hypothetical protein
VKRDSKKSLIFGLLGRFSSVWWHTGESEFENNSTLERERLLFWERFKIPGWLPFKDINLN